MSCSSCHTVRDNETTHLIQLVKHVGLTRFCSPYIPNVETYLRYMSIFLTDPADDVSYCAWSQLQAAASLSTIPGPGLHRMAPAGRGDGATEAGAVDASNGAPEIDVKIIPSRITLLSQCRLCVPLCMHRCICVWMYAHVNVGMSDNVVVHFYKDLNEQKMTFDQFCCFPNNLICHLTRRVAYLNYRLMTLWVITAASALTETLHNVHIGLSKQACVCAYYMYVCMGVFNGWFSGFKLPRLIHFFYKSTPKTNGNPLKSTPQISLLAMPLCACK